MLCQTYRILAPSMTLSHAHIQVQHFAIIVDPSYTVYTIKGLNVQVTKIHDKMNN